MSPHTPHFVSSLPPEETLRLRPGPSIDSGQAKAGSAALAGQEGARPLVALRTALPPEGLVLVWKYI